MPTVASSRPPAGRKRRKKPHREQLPAGEILCAYCTAKCCRYFALPIEKPTTLKEFEYIRWYLLHQHATVFVEDGSWYLLVHTRCKHLQADNRCSIYPTRPQICRQYSTKDCEYEDNWVYEQYFETAEQVVEYTEAVMAFRKGAKIRSPKPDPLQVPAHE
ncbi:MAG TPA: YkgJ family cysteine cluster protein [Planctomycetaceae bacterium]|nr:YkgJ family cysteine cluster protein [Planctomycetaceae bacterium]